MFLLSEDLRPTREQVISNPYYRGNIADEWLTPRKASTIMKELGFTTKHENRGSVVRIEPDRLKAICARFGLPNDPAPLKGDDS